jgi:hypothetical protein
LFRAAAASFLYLSSFFVTRYFRRFELGDRRHQRQVDVDPQLTVGWQVGDLHPRREIARVPLHGQHAAEVIRHRLAFAVGEVAGHLVDNRVLTADALPLAAHRQLMI